MGPYYGSFGWWLLRKARKAPRPVCDLQIDWEDCVKTGCSSATTISGVFEHILVDHGACERVRELLPRAHALYTAWRRDHFQAAFRAMVFAKAGAAQCAEVDAWVAICKASPCPYCAREVPRGLMQTEHVVAVSRGGEHSVENTVSACRDCNLNKKDKPLILWLLSRPDLCGVTRGEASASA